MPRRTTLFFALVVTVAALASPRAATAQQIQLTGPLGGCNRMTYCGPWQRTHLEVTGGMAVLGEIVTSAPPGRRADAGVTDGFTVEARVMPRSWLVGAAFAATLALGPTLRLDRGPVLEQVVADAAPVLQLPLGRFSEGISEHHILASVTVGISGRWAWLDAAPTTLALGPRFGLGVDHHRGRCGKTVVGFGLDVRPLYEMRAGPLHTVLVAGQLHAGWDLPPQRDACDG